MIVIERGRKVGEGGRLRTRKLNIQQMKGKRVDGLFRKLGILNKRKKSGNGKF